MTSPTATPTTSEHFPTPDHVRRHAPLPAFIGEVGWRDELKTYLKKQGKKAGQEGQRFAFRVRVPYVAWSKDDESEVVQFQNYKVTLWDRDAQFAASIVRSGMVVCVRGIVRAEIYYAKDDVTKAAPQLSYQIERAELDTEFSTPTDDMIHGDDDLDDF